MRKHRRPETDRLESSSGCVTCHVWRVAKLDQSATKGEALRREQFAMTATSTPTENPVVNNILQHQPAVLDFIGAAAVIGKSQEAAYAERARGTFPLRVRQHGKRLVVFTSDLIQYLETGKSQAEQSAPLIRKTYKVRIGRPTKPEALEAARRGLSVRELRAQAKLGVEGGAA